MSAPIKHTCPDIDDLQTDIMSNAKTICDELEKVRNSNAVLREWGEDLEKELEEAKDEIVQQNDLIQELESEVNDLKSELRSIEKQL